MKHRTTDPSPADLYLATLSRGSQGMRNSLDTIAEMIDPDHGAESLPWHELTYRDTMAVRLALVKRYEPATVRYDRGARVRNSGRPTLSGLGLTYEQLALE